MRRFCIIQVGRVKWQAVIEPETKTLRTHASLRAASRIPSLPNHRTQNLKLAEKKKSEKQGKQKEGKQKEGKRKKERKRLNELERKTGLKQSTEMEIEKE